MSSCKKRFLVPKSKVKRKSKRFDLLTLCPLLSNEGDGKVDVDSKRNNLHDRPRYNGGGDDDTGKETIRSRTETVSVTTFKRL